MQLMTGYIRIVRIIGKNSDAFVRPEAQTLTVFRGEYTCRSTLMRVTLRVTAGLGRSREPAPPGL